jgi:hypothetical protein
VQKPVEPVSTRQKPVECPVECPDEPVFEYQLNQPKNQLNQYFPESNFGQDSFKKLYYILSLRINKGKIEVLDQGF